MSLLVEAPVGSVMSANVPSAPAAPPAMDLNVPPQTDAARMDEDGAGLAQIECATGQSFLHSPPESNNNPKTESSDSELSDLDDDAVSDPTADETTKPEATENDATAASAAAAAAQEEDDIGEIEPHHYSGTVPVFKPTMNQFKDFKRFMEKIDRYGMTTGIVKIISPQEWRDSQPPLDDLIKNIRVREPIKQDIMGSNGTYRQVNILHGRSYNIPQWRQLCEQSEHQPPARRGERRMNREKPKVTRPRPAEPATKKDNASTGRKRGPGRPPRTRTAKSRQVDGEDQTVAEDRPMTPVSPKPDGGVQSTEWLDERSEKTNEEQPSVVESVEAEAVVKGEPELEAAGTQTPPQRRMGGIVRRGGGVKTQSISARRKYSRREGSVKIDEEAFRDFDYRMDVSDFTPERCEELERIYWKTLTYAQPLYGADLMGTLFHESTEMWNLNRLPNLLDVLGTKVPGVNTAYLYLGMWKATFAWHLEDVDLYSINYLHFGAPKQWYSISQADARRFENAMKNIWPTDAKSCPQFLRHKGFLISPSHLLQHYNIRVNKCVSYPGEFVVTYPYGYHSGYNLGYNCAEAVNFALDSWLPMGKIAKKCECAQAQDSVWVDVFEIERRLRGEETEYEETDEDEDDEDEDEDSDDEPSGLPTPPGTIKWKAQPRKRKRETTEKKPKKRVKKLRPIKTKAEPICCLCPNDIPGLDVLPTDDGRRAHRMCAQYLADPYIDVVNGKETVHNIPGTGKSRSEMRCLYCRSKRGACFGCSQQKCSRSYHATCAAAAGVFVEEAEVPVYGEDGTEYKDLVFEFSCRFHRTKRDKRFDGAVLEKDQRIRKAAAALKEGEFCQMQYFRGDIFAGIVVENRADEEMVLLDIIPGGDRVEVEWKWLLVPDPTDFHLPRASANAKPLPKSRKAKDKLNIKRGKDDTPRKDAPFVEGYTWAEFSTYECKNPEQAKVSFEKPDQLWYYLGSSSTDAKAQYTEDPSKPLHNPRGNFLDTIPKPPRPVVAQPTQQYQAYTQPQPPNFPGKGGRPYVYKPRKPINAALDLSSFQPNQKGFAGPTTQPQAAFQGPVYQPPHNGQPGQPGQHHLYQQPSQQPIQHHSAPPPRQHNVPHRAPLATWSAPAQLQHSVAMKLPYYQKYQNRDATQYRSPYSPLGGFTNGYQDNRGYFMQAQAQRAYLPGPTINNHGYHYGSPLAGASPHGGTVSLPPPRPQQYIPASSKPSPAPVPLKQTPIPPPSFARNDLAHGHLQPTVGSIAPQPPLVNQPQLLGAGQPLQQPPLPSSIPAAPAIPATPTTHQSNATTRPPVFVPSHAAPRGLVGAHEEHTGTTPPPPTKPVAKPPVRQTPVPLPSKYLAAITSTNRPPIPRTPITPTTASPSPSRSASRPDCPDTTPSMGSKTPIHPSPVPQVQVPVKPAASRISTTPIPLPPRIPRPSAIAQTQSQPAPTTPTHAQSNGDPGLSFGQPIGVLREPLPSQPTHNPTPSPFETQQGPSTKALAPTALGREPDLKAIDQDNDWPEVPHNSMELLDTMMTNLRKASIGAVPDQ